MREGIDLMKAGLSVEEGFIASRIDGRTKVRDIAHMVGKSPEETHRILSRLAKAGVVRLTEGGTADIERPKVTSDLDGYGNFIFPPSMMQAECDLDEDERKRIIYFHHNLEVWTFYELLQTKHRADVKDIKRAYFERSKEWHPDRFRRPNLGPFKSQIDDIFKAVQEAYRILSDPRARAEYDEENVLMVDQDEIADMLREQRKKERDARRAPEQDRRRRQRNPMRARIQKARRFYEEAKQLREDGQLMDALRIARMAQTVEARPAHEKLVETLQSEAGELRIQPLLRRGQSQEKLTNWDNAIDAFREAVRIAPEHGAARLRLAFNMVMGNRDPDLASPHAQKAVQLMPSEPEAHFVLGLCYERAGLEKAAKNAYAKAVELKPNYSDAKKRLRSLKWGF